MKTRLFTIGIAVVILSCNTKQRIAELETDKQESITGELYFKLIDFSSFYGVQDSTSQLFENYFDSLFITPNISEQDSQLLSSFQLLKKLDLVDKPTIHLRVDSLTIVTAYLNERDYELVKKFDRQELIAENMKVELSLKGQSLENNLFLCDSILSMSKIEGKTFWRK